MNNKKNDENQHNHTEEDDFCFECDKKHLKDKGVSNEGFWINPDYMTDEDEIVNIEVKKEISVTFRVRVHKDHKEHFDVDEYVNGDEIDGFWMDTDPFELIDGSTEYWRVIDTQKVSGDKVKDDFFHYECCDGLFYPPFDKSKSVYKEQVDKPKIVEVHKHNQRWMDGVNERNETFKKYQTELDNMLSGIVEEKRWEDRKIPF